MMRDKSPDENRSSYQNEIINPGPSQKI